MRLLFVALVLALPASPSWADSSARELMSQALEAQIDATPPLATFVALAKAEPRPEVAPGAHRAVAADLAHAAIEARRAARREEAKGQAEAAAADEARSARGAAQSAAGQENSKAAKVNHGHPRSTP